MSLAKPLKDITVIEIGTSVAAPFAGLILADLGARVIKVENPNGGDHARAWGPPFWKGTSSVFYALNRGKLGITIDLTDASQREALSEIIISEADAVIQNLRPGLLDKFGLSYARHAKKNPALIWCDLGAFGATGPLADKPGYDPLAQASTGIMSVTGEPHGEPARAGVSLVDMGSGMWTVIGLLSALIARASSGRGCRVSSSLYETGLAWMAVHLAGYAASGEVRGPHGSGLAEIVPYQAFRTRDSWLMIAAGNDGLFKKLCAALDLSELPGNPKYAVNSQRIRNREELIAIISDRVHSYATETLAKRLDDMGVPNAPMLRVNEVMEHPQTRALGITVKCDEDELPLIGIPLSMDGQRPRATSPAPKLGAHNALIQKKVKA